MAEHNFKNLLLVFISTNIILVFYQLMILPGAIVPAMDGAKYLQMTQSFITGHFVQVEFPFSQRILAPYLASLLSFKDINISFKIINWLAFNVTTIILVMTWQRFAVPLIAMLFGISWLLFNPMGMQLYYNYVISTDTLGYLFCAVLIAIIFSRRYYYLLLIAPLGTLERESFIAAVAMLFITEMLFLFKHKKIMPVFVIFIALSLSIYANYLTHHHWFAGAAGSSIQTLQHFVLLRITDPLSILKWLCAILLAIGGVPALIHKCDLEIFQDHRLFALSLISVTYLLFGLLAGTDMTRIIFDGMPYIMTAVFLFAAKNQAFTLSRMMVLYIQSGLALLVGYGLWPAFIDYAKSPLEVWQVFLTLVFGYVITWYFARRFANPLK